VIVTDHVDAVRKFVDEFDRLWEEYAPWNCCFGSSN
jgi:hypothetical protein